MYKLKNLTLKFKTQNIRFGAIWLLHCTKIILFC